MKPNSDYHFNQMPDNEPFKRGLGYMVSVEMAEYHALLVAKERVAALEEEVEQLKKRLRELR